MRPTRSLLLSAALLASVAGCGNDDKNSGGVTPIPYTDDGKLTVMTRNLYLGADLAPVIAAGADPARFITATSAAFTQVQSNNAGASPGAPPARLVAVADEIAAAKPDLVGLQEASLWRTQAQSDAATHPAPNATDVVYDYVAILLSELEKRGLTYVAVETLELFDVEVPIVTGQDVRLTDRQVILARSGVPVRNARGVVFTNLLPLPVFNTTVPVKRGFTSVQVTIGGEDVTFFDTHLESFDDQARDAQAAELGVVLAGTSGRAVLVGDLNSTPGTGGHLAATTAGFTDVWTTLNPAAEGFSCCFPPDLHQTTPGLTQRIDHVLVHGAAGQLVPQSIDLVGEAPADRTASGLWPSDHGGVVATVTP